MHKTTKELKEWLSKCPYKDFYDAINILIEATLIVELIENAFNEDRNLEINYDDWQDIKEFGYKETLKDD